MAITDKLALWKQRKQALADRRATLEAKYAQLDIQRKQLEDDESKFETLEIALAAELATL